MAQTRQRKLIVPLVMGAVVLAIIGALTGCGEQPKKQVEVPDLRYYYQEQAEQMLADVGLKVGEVSEENNGVSFDGLVLSQSPAAKETVEEGSAINITIATGNPIPTSLTVPDLRGLSPEEAEIALISTFIIPLPSDAVYSDDVEPGKVCAQSAAAGSQIPLDPQDLKDGNLPVVSYSTSLGKEQVNVPDLVGKTSQEARDALANAGLAVDSTTSYNDTVEADRVISQSVAKDITVPKGTVVTIEISQGKKPVTRVLVPDIRTYTLDEAKRSLESAGLNYTYSGDESGRVITVHPNPNTEVDQGSTVTFTLQRTVEQQRQEDLNRQQQELDKQRQELDQQRQDQERQQQELDQQRQQQEQKQQEQVTDPKQEVIPDYSAIATAVSASNVNGAPEAVATLVSQDPPVYLVHFVVDNQLYEISVDGYTAEVLSQEVTPIEAD